MICPFCSHTDTKVLESRETGPSLEHTRRRRECLKCEKRFTTYERVEQVPIIVIKKDGTRAQFDREKLRKSVIIPCQKRPITQEQISKIVDEVELELRQRDDTEIPTKEIGDLVVKKLKKIDKVAYIRFASVYREFTDLETFEKELKKLLKKE
jgi:transcriptional repressor NrdR